MNSIRLLVRLLVVLALLHLVRLPAAAQAPAAAAQAAAQALAVLLRLHQAALLAVVLLAQAQVVSLALFSHQDVILLTILLLLGGMGANINIMAMSQLLEVMVGHLLMELMIRAAICMSGTIWMAQPISIVDIEAAFLILTTPIPCRLQFEIMPSRRVSS